MAQTTTEIRCPKCNSNQLTANKKGFSGKKAVAGAVLTGGIGLLAGTLGSNKVKITCLACGKEFKPGEGKKTTILISNPEKNNQESNISKSSELDLIDQRILELCSKESLLSAVKYCKENKEWDLSKSKKYVENLAAQNGVEVQGGGCFIATACYGNYNSPEVIILRKYRDERLLSFSLGKLFVWFYYLTSPRLAELISKSKASKKAVRKYLLQPLIRKINQNDSSIRKDIEFK
ncbi:MAG: hypothetical protein JEZ09_15740 [Salinivirgaceae bacterium]|nr:hypothetical protein [Salinivirgaceae bacterium]